jgi:hypothetical protein
MTTIIRGQNQGCPVFFPPQVDIDTRRELLTIPSNFYGVNVHPGEAKYEMNDVSGADKEMSQFELLRDLNPDSVRIMTNARVSYEDPANSNRRRWLSTGENNYDFSLLDALLERITSLNTEVEVYLCTGFYPPKWITGVTDEEERIDRKTVEVPPPDQEARRKYAQYMAEVVYHCLKGDYGSRIKGVSIGNEPENVNYDFDDFFGEQVGYSYEAIRGKFANDPEIAQKLKLGGPVTGYTDWKPTTRDRKTPIINPKTGNNKKLSWGDGMKQAGESQFFDFADWHVYNNGYYAVLRTANHAKEKFDKRSLVISELNRDSEYGDGAKGDQSKILNTTWPSVAWLAFHLDKLQEVGVEQIFYFCWREDRLGLISKTSKYPDPDIKIRPNFFTLRALTNELGRRRVKAKTIGNGIGCIATCDSATSPLVAMIYNTSTSPAKVRVKINSQTAPTLTYSHYSEDWNKDREEKYGLPEEETTSDGFIPVDAGGFTIVRAQVQGN